ncbi:MAG: helix-turn-helix transcriptional regulator [Dorea sp.]|nr:helix-turn-helix transcriptional regulator [Dorea sp.]
MKRKIRPLCELPRNGFFCGPDKYLKLQKHTVSSEMFPVMEFDSYFILVKKGHGNFIINGEEFSVQPGCVSWIQCSQVLTICPDFGNQLHLWVCAYDYQLLNYYAFNKISPTTELEVVNNIPVIGPDGAEVEQILHLFEQFHKLSKTNTYGSTVIRSSFLRQIELLYNRFAKGIKDTYQFDSFPLSRKASLYIAAHSTAPLTISDVVAAVCPDTSEASLNHALLVATGLNFSQYLNRLRLAHAMAYFLYDSLSFDYISSISGFNEEITFFRRFKTMTGMTPQTYLNQMLSNGKEGRIYRGTIMSETLISAVSYLYENMSEQIDSKIITRDLYTSKNILRIQFKSRLDSSYKEILSLFRVRYAESLLTTTNLPIMDIAIESGFGSDRTMARVFFSINGLSPGEFRKQRRLAEQQAKETHR